MQASLFGNIEAQQPIIVNSNEKALIACEESQVVCKAFRSVGIEAYSCDLQECSGGHPEWHIIGNAIEEAYSGKYSLMIAHPPCTFVSRAGARWLYQHGKLNAIRYEKGLYAKAFFDAMLNAPIKRIAVENPTPMKVFKFPPHSQIIQPYAYGHAFSKRTLLWLKNLPLLSPIKFEKNFTPFLPSNTGGAKRGQKATIISITQKQSSRTFEGIAMAMAYQWGKLITNNSKL